MPFITAYRAGETSVEQYIQGEKLIYWYRPIPKGVQGHLTDSSMQGSPDNSSGNFFRCRPNGWETMQDEVYVVSLLKSPASVHVTSGQMSKTFEARAGACAFSINMGVGKEANKQTFSVVRGSETVMEDTSLKNIMDN